MPQLSAGLLLIFVLTCSAFERSFATGPGELLVCCYACNKKIKFILSLEHYIVIN